MNDLDVTMSGSFAGFGCISILNGKYVLLFGGSSYNDQKVKIDYYDDILIYSVKTKTFIKSRVKCPEKAEFEVVKMNDSKKDEVVVTGFVRNTWNEFKISTHLFPPHYLIKIMHKYYLNQYVHLFHIDSYSPVREECKHWKMSLIDIISSLLY